MVKQAGLEDVATEASERVTKLAEEIMNASRTNRELLQHFVTTEVDKAAARLGFARAEEVEALREEIASLRTQLNEATVRAGRTAATKKAAKKAPARKTAATMTATKKSTATKSPGRKPPRKKAATAERSSSPE
jgi:formate dehydrogenase assembly factor FdhD